MEQKQKPERIFLSLTGGVLFAAYSAYNIFIVARDSPRGLSPEGQLISVVVALLFGVFAAFLWTAGWKKKDFRFLLIRRVVFLVALAAVFALKLRMAGQVAAYFELSKPHTVLYGAAYLSTQAALAILFIYYAFILKKLPRYPRASVILPVLAAALFLIALILETILFFAYGIGQEANRVRTLVMRPVFYLGFICLSVYFLVPVLSAKRRTGR